MLRYVTVRLGYSALTLFLVTLLTFVIIHIAPGGPAIMLHSDMTQEELREIRTSLGLDQPLVVQYGRWSSTLLRGQFGRSFVEKRPISDMLDERLPNSVLLGAASFLLAAALGIPAGVVAATRPGSRLDYTVSTLSVGGLSIPNYWLGIMLILLFSVQLRWLPTGGIGTVGAEFSLPDLLRHLLLPAVVLCAYQLATFMRYTRTAMIEALQQDYVRTARAKGLAERFVVYRHALRNALVPIVTIVGMNIPHLVVGAAITESIFSWPGMGQLVVQAALTRDYPVIMAITVIVTVAVVLANFAVDLAYGLVNPKIRLE